MSITKNSEGAYVISEIKYGYLTTRRYYGYTKREAIRLFKEDTK